MRNFGIVFKCLFFLTFGFLVASTTRGEAPEVVFLYKGKGADLNCWLGLEHIFMTQVEPRPIVQHVGSFKDFIGQIKHETRTALLAMPGGNSTLYEQDFTRLMPDERALIVNRLKTGALSYLGVCAGAYFAAESYQGKFSVIFGQELIASEFFSMTGNHRLALFPKMGAAFDRFVAESMLGSLSPQVVLEHGKKAPIFWNGGPHITPKYGDKILAHYENEQAAIVSRAYVSADGESESKVIVSGIHFELLNQSEDLLQKNIPWHFRESLKNVESYNLVTKAVVEEFGFSFTS